MACAFFTWLRPPSPAPSCFFTLYSQSTSRPVEQHDRQAAAGHGERHAQPAGSPTSKQRHRRAGAGRGQQPAEPASAQPQLQQDETGVSCTCTSLKTGVSCTCTSLYLDHKGIAKIANDTVSDMPNLRTLYLSNNDIAHVSNDTWSNLPNLRDLILHDNPGVPFARAFPARARISTSTTRASPRLPTTR